MNYHLARLCVSCVVLTTLSAADFYVAPPPSGSDGANGSQGTPWATIGKALATSGNNDRIFLARGGTWREGFTIGGNRQLLAYGSGADPLITSSVIVPMTGTWPSNPAVRTGSVGTEALSLWVNGTFQPLARYPNSGFLLTANGTTLNSITGTSMPARAAGRWTGAQIRWHRWHWFWETRPITADSGGSILTLSTNAVNATGQTAVNWETGLVGITSGFFVDKDLDELDAPGEWFSSSSQVYVYPPSGVDGSTMTVEVATTVAPVQVNGATIRGIAFRRYHGNAMEINNPSTIEDCTFEQIGDTAISTTYNSGGTQIRRNIFRDVHNAGVTTLQGGAATVIERNLLHRIGMERGYGGSGPWRNNGIVSNVGAVTITLNRMIDIGYIGILLGNTPGNIATRNLIVRALSTSNDGAGIYTYKGPNTMNENIVLDTRGSQVAGEPFYPFGNGIWPEFLDGIANSQILDNTVAGNNGAGIALINNFTCNVSRNVAFDNLNTGLQLGIYNGNTAAQNHTLDDNVFATLATTRRLPLEGNFASWYNPATPSTGIIYENGSTVDFGLLRRSIFVVGSGTYAARGDGGGSPTFSSLASLAAGEPSWVENTGTTSTQNAVLLINDTENASDLAVPSGTWTRTDGSAVGATVNLAAFRSVVLIGSGAAPVSPVYQVASGIDWRQTVPTTQYLMTQQEIALSRSGTAISDGGNDTVTGTVFSLATALDYTFSNVGGAALTLTPPVTISGQTNCTVNVTQQPAASVAASGSTHAVMTVTPTSAGAWSFAASLVNNDSNENPTNWTVSGTASAAPAPEVAVSRNGTAVADGSTDTFSGSTAGVTQTLTYTVANLGSAALNITPPAVIGALVNCAATVTTQPASSVAAGASTTMVVSVTPSAAGSWSCAVSFTCSDSDEATTNWTISGSAAATAPEIALSRSATVIPDGQTDTVGSGIAGTPLSLTYTVANSGSANLTMSNPTLGSLVNCTATVSANPAASIAAFSGTTSLTIQVTPIAAGAWSLGVSLVNNDGNENPTDWTIQGTGVASGGETTVTNGSSSSSGTGCGAGAGAALFLLGCSLVMGPRRRR
jgi:hypothetical protein